MNETHMAASTPVYVLDLKLNITKRTRRSLHVRRGNIMFHDPDSEL